MVNSSRTFYKIFFGSLLHRNFSSCKTTLNVDLDKCFTVVNEVVKDAGQLIEQHNSNQQKFDTKQHELDVVTATDKAVEKLLISGIRKCFPEHKFIGEEESSKAGTPIVLTDAPTWMIDPIDGTLNFIHAFPHSCISVGLKVNKITEIGIVFNPMLKQLFTSRRGQGACHNGQSIHVSAQKELSKALIMAEFGAQKEETIRNVINENMEKITANSHGVRVFGSAALDLCMVAMGAADGYFEFGLHAWDMCAGELMVREAGGVIMDPSGGTLDIMSRRILAAATKELALELSQCLTQYHPKPRDD